MKILKICSLSIIILLKNPASVPLKTSQTETIEHHRSPRKKTNAHEEKKGI